MSTVGLAIRRVVGEQPGIHFRGLARAACVSSAGQLRHHLDRLAHQGILVEVEDGRYKRFFVAGEHDPKLRTEMARFCRTVPRRIAKLLLRSPMNRTELRRSLGCADSTLGYHLTRMVVMGDLAKSRGPNCCRYSLTSADMVRKMLALQAADPDGIDGADANLADLAPLRADLLEVPPVPAARRLAALRSISPAATRLPPVGLSPGAPPAGPTPAPAASRDAAPQEAPPPRLASTPPPDETPAFS